MGDYGAYGGGAFGGGGFVARCGRVLVVPSAGRAHSPTRPCSPGEATKDAGDRGVRLRLSYIVSDARHCVRCL